MMIKITLFAFTFLLPLIGLAQSNQVKNEERPARGREVPLLTPVMTRPNLKIETPPVTCELFVPIDLAFGDAKCFKLGDVSLACDCLKRESYVFKELKKNKALLESVELTTGKSMSLGIMSSSVNVLAEVSGAATTGDTDYVKSTAASAQDHSLSHETDRNIFQRGKDLIVGRDKKIAATTNEYLDYIKEYDSCIPFGEFSLTNSIPKKSFIDVLSDPKLKVEDFTDGIAMANDDDAKKRREKIKSFMLFNPAWETVFKTGDKNLAFEKIKSIYKDVDAEKLYLSSKDEKEKNIIINKMEKEKNEFFHSQNLGKHASKNRKRKEKDFEKSFKYIMDNANDVEGNIDLLDKVVKFKGFPSLEECRHPFASTFACQGTYMNYCNNTAKKDLSPEKIHRLERALEVVDDSTYIMDRYKDVTKRYCDKKMRIGDKSKINGPMPESMSYREFKKAYCEDKSISIKGQIRESACNKNQNLLSMFANQFVDGQLISKDGDADFEREFLQLYSNIGLNTDEGINQFVNAVVNQYSTPGSDREASSAVNTSIDRLLTSVKDRSTPVFGDADIIKSIAKSSSAMGPSNNSPVTSLSPVASDAPASAGKTTTTEEVLHQASKVVDQVAQPQMGGASLNPEVAQNYSIPSYIPQSMPVAQIENQKTEVDSQVKKLEDRINVLADEKQARAEADRKKEISSLEKELSSLREYSKSIEKMLDDKEQAKVAASETESSSVGRSIASTGAAEINLPAGAHATAAVASSVIPSRVYEDHFGDANFHNQQPLGQSAMINRQISESKGSNDALMSVYANQSVKAMLDKGESSSSGNFVLMTSPIEITEANEGKFSKREFQVEQIFIEELRSNPDKLKSFFEEKKIEHIGLLTLKSTSNNQVNYMVRKDEKGKLLVIPVNIARKSKLDDLRRTLQVQAF